MTIFRFEDIPDQSGKTVLVTGANVGIGYHIAKQLAGHGARVLLGCRDASKAGDAMTGIAEEHPQANTEFVPLDLADLDSIQAAARQINARGRLDALVNNAGLMMPPLSRAMNVEKQFAVNHLGHFALTGLLLDKLAADGGGRVVVQSSIAHRRGDIAFDNLDASKGYKAQRFYNQSKLANLLFMYELDRRLRAASKPVAAIGCHPGVAETQITRHLPGGRFIGSAIGMALNGARDAALPALQAVTDPAAQGGEYFGPYGLMELRGRTSGRAVTTSKARNAASARRLWTVSEELTGVTYGLEN